MGGGSTRGRQLGRVNSGSQLVLQQRNCLFRPPSSKSGVAPRVRDAFPAHPQEPDPPAAVGGRGWQIRTPRSALYRMHRLSSKLAIGGQHGSPVANFYGPRRRLEGVGTNKSIVATPVDPRVDPFELTPRVDPPNQNPFLASLIRLDPQSCTMHRQSHRLTPPLQQVLPHRCAPAGHASLLLRRFRPNDGRGVSISAIGRPLSTCHRRRGTPAKCNPLRVGQIWPTSGQVRSNSTKFGPTWTDSGPARFCPIPTIFCLIWPDPGRIGTKSDRAAPNLVDLVRIRSNFGQVWLDFTHLGLISPEMSQMSAKVRSETAEIWQNVGPNSVFKLADHHRTSGRLCPHLFRRLATPAYNRRTLRVLVRGCWSLLGHASDKARRRHDDYDLCLGVVADGVLVRPHRQVRDAQHWGGHGRHGRLLVPLHGVSRGPSPGCLGRRRLDASRHQGSHLAKQEFWQQRLVRFSKREVDGEKSRWDPAPRSAIGVPSARFGGSVLARWSSAKEQLLGVAGGSP